VVNLQGEEFMTGKIMKLFLLIILITVFSMNHAANAQGAIRINIDHIENGQFPLLEVYVSVTSTQGLPLKNLDISDFSVSEDDQSITNFDALPIQNVKKPLAIILLIDTSGSMGGTPLRNAVTAAKAFADTLSQQDQVAILGFANTPYIVQNFTDDKSIVKTSLDSLAAGGDTTLYDGIVQAVELLKNRTERKIIVLITDGTDSSIGSFDYKMAMDETSLWAIPIYPIGFGNVDRNELEQMALQTGGVAQIQPSSSDLQSAFNLVLQVLREQYLIRYTSKLPADGANHNLQVAVSSQSTTRSFIALPGEIIMTLPFQDGQIVGGNVLLKPIVDPPPPAPLLELSILLDGEQLQSIFSEPFEYTWNSTSVAPGEHQLAFIVKDTAGNSAQKSVVLNIQPPITVSIITPTEGQEFNGPAQVMASVEAMNGTSKIEFMVDNVLIQELMDPPIDGLYEITIDWGNYTKGLHLLQVKATDNNGFSGTHEVVVQTGGKDYWLLALIIGIGLAALAIPFGMRSRSRRKSGGISVKAGKSSLREIKGSSLGQSWALGTQAMGVGRGRSNYIQLKSIKASRDHAIIKYENGKHVLYNRKEENPPVVNGEQVNQKRILESGDVIKFGEDILRYEQH
jgi:VWFA-related protein